MNAYIQLDPGTISEILYAVRYGSGDTEEVAEQFGIPESLVTSIIMGK